MKVRLWPYMAFSVSAWLLPIATLGYLFIGVTMKVGHSILEDDNKPNEKDGIQPATPKDLLLDTYHIVTWPWYVSTVGMKRTFIIVSGGFLTISLLGGLLYWAGSDYDIPESYVKEFEKAFVQNESLLSYQSRFELQNRIESGFEYTDLLWLKREIHKVCSGDQIQKDYFAPLLMGFMQVFPPFASALVATESLFIPTECKLAKSDSNKS